jgi:hypothetical protein
VLEREKSLARFVTADMARAEADFKAESEKIAQEFFVELRTI